MRQLLAVLAGIAIIVTQVWIGARAFFPDAMTTDNDSLGDILDEKNSILDKITPEELAFVTSHPVFTVGVDPNFYPLEMFDERGRYTGIGGDYLRLLSKMTGLQFRPVALANWADTENAARNGNIDIFMAAAKTGRRDEFMQFTPPYVNLPGIIMTRRDSGLDKLDLAGLAGKKVAVTRDYSWHDFLKEFHPEIIAVPAATTLDALHMVTAGEADAILDYEFNLLEKIRTAGILQMQKAGEVDSSYGHAVAVRKDLPQLFNVIDMALANITPRERTLLAQKWLEREKPASRETHIQWLFFFFSEATLLCFGLLWLFNHAVRREAASLAEIMEQKCD